LAKFKSFDMDRNPYKAGGWGASFSRVSTISSSPEIRAGTSNVFIKQAMMIPFYKNDPGLAPSQVKNLGRDSRTGPVLDNIEKETPHPPLGQISSKASQNFWTII
jgi:hypothetical protein